jgi:nitroimidazol reductase NimA-like FMN-containing flavoprotein (pyridoxamine 5'-phosphate oxidase superfamily)
MTDTMTWLEIANRLSDPPNYWLVTVTPTGAPHTVPVWGVVADGDFYMYSERSTIKARNIAANDRVALHLESGADVLIVYGKAVELIDGAAVVRVCEAFAGKYTAASEIEWLPTNDPGTILWQLEPASAQAWELSDMDGSQRRWKA